MSNPGQRETPATGIDRGSHIASLASSLPRIGATVDSELDATLWRLTGGEIGLSDLTPALQAWWTVAAHFGRQTANSDRIERLTYERDLWYACYANGWTPGEYLRRRTDALWAEAVAA